MKQYADLNLTGHVLTDFLLTTTTTLTAAGKMRYDATAKKYYGFTTSQTAFLTEDDESSLDVNSATKLATARSLWGNAFDGTADVSGDITLGSGKKLYFGGTDYYLELKDGALHTNVGLYSDSFISARGVDDEAGGGGGASLDLVWESLTTNTDDYKDYKIDKGHVPTDIPQANIVGLVSALATINTSITGITDLIPSEASSSNQLADKAFVNSSIASNTATFWGTYETVSDLPTGENVKSNDYAFVIATDSSGNPEYDRYKYNGTAWVFEYTLNNSSFTAAQWSAINSGITSALVTGMVTSVTVPTTGNAITGLSISNHVLTATRGAFFTTAGNGLAASGATVSAKIDAASESYLSVSSSGLKLSGVAAAISAAVKTALTCSTASVTSGTSKAVTVSGQAKGVSTQYEGAECVCEVSYGAYDSTAKTQTVTVTWGFAATSSKPMTINILYIPS